MGRPAIELVISRQTCLSGDDNFLMSEVDMENTGNRLWEPGGGCDTAFGGQRKG